MTKDELFALAIECGIADKDLSSDRQLVSDHGSCTEEVARFARAIAERCAKECEQANLYGDYFAEKIRERFGISTADKG
jgi:hypothetical protein